MVSCAFLHFLFKYFPKKCLIVMVSKTCQAARAWQFHMMGGYFPRYIFPQKYFFLEWGFDLVAQWITLILDMNTQKAII